MPLEEYLIEITTDANGDSTDTSEQAILGHLDAVDVVDGDLADNFDLTLAYVNSQGVTKTLLTLTNLSADATYHPRHVVHGETGTALTGTAGGDRTGPLVAGKVTVTTADGGVTKSGAVILYVDEG
jgi:hypothetical protein